MMRSDQGGMRESLKAILGILAFAAIFFVLPFMVYKINKYFHHDRIEQMIQKRVKAECMK